jgi:exodeoxyribonuclease VII small subunit
MSESSAPRPVAELTYEQARDELVALVATLESGRSGLEESMRMWQRGEELAAHCSGWLDKAEESLRTDGDARADEEPEG